MRMIHQSAFCMCRNLKEAALNEGLEALGTDEYPEGGGGLHGVFAESTLDCIELPSTLRRIEYNAFRECTNLRNIKLPDRLEYIGKYSFSETGLEEVTLPASLRTVA